MKNLNRIILLAVAAALILTTLAVALFAADGASALVVTADKTELEPGDEVTFTVSLKNNPGVWAVQFDLELDPSVFEFVSFSTEGCLDLPNGLKGYVKNEDVFRFGGATTDYFNDMTDDGTLVSVTYKAKEAAALGSYSVKAAVDAKNTINTDGKPVAIADGSISITIANAPVDTTTPAPADTTTPAPADTTTPAPADTTTPAPADTTTPAPVDTTTPAPVDTTTPVTADTTPPEPADTTTPAPVETDPAVTEPETTPVATEPETTPTETTPAETTPDTEGGKSESEPPQTGDFGAAIIPVVVAVSVIGIGITAVSVKSHAGRK